MESFWKSTANRNRHGSSSGHEPDETVVAQRQSLQFLPGIPKALPLTSPSKVDPSL